MNQEHKINPNALKGWLLKQINVLEKSKKDYPSITESLEEQIQCWNILLRKLETNDFQEYERVHINWYKQYKGE